MVILWLPTFWSSKILWPPCFSFQKYMIPQICLGPSPFRRKCQPLTTFFLWQESVVLPTRINPLIQIWRYTPRGLFPKFQLILVLCTSYIVCIHVIWHCSIEFSVKLILVNENLCESCFYFTLKWFLLNLQKWGQPQIDAKNSIFEILFLKAPSIQNLWVCL